MRHVDVDRYLARHRAWLPVLEPIRRVLLDSGFEEAFKWRRPTYTMAGKNLVGLGAFGDYAGIWFFHGALLSDPKCVLVNAQAGKTRGMRQWRFRRGEAVDIGVLRSYVTEAVAHAKAGRWVQPQARVAIPSPAILGQALSQDDALKHAFEQLSKSQRRDYIEYLAEAKRETTQQRRLARIIPMIKSHEGLNDRYRP